MIACQKAPSAKRCIKTAIDHKVTSDKQVRKHRAPKGALRPTPNVWLTMRDCTSESTERQKVH